MLPARVVRFVLKPAVFALSLAPLGWLVSARRPAASAPNPIEAVTHRTGDWTLRFLLLTLAVTPLRVLTGWNALVRFRRMLGLFAFFYALPPPADLRLVRQVLRVAEIVARHPQAAVHHDRIPGVRGAGAAGRHVDGRDDPAARRARLAARCTGCLRVGRSPASSTSGGS